MSREPDLDLEKFNLEGETARKRLQKLFEFLRVVCQREAQPLNQPEKIPEHEKELSKRD
jgi:hypothetical protein